ncbi:MAG: MEDS domain-containing protein [Candidatus Geothermarchaeales archaeon]
MEKSEIIGFVKGMESRDHVILLYTDRRDKHDILFTYLRAGLEKGEAAAYVAGEETADQIRQAMEEFDIDVERYEKAGALRIIDYRDWYIIDGEFDASTTIGLWEKLLDESVAKGFKGLRVTGEMACFFENDMLKELLEYERSLHRTLEIALTAICAYDSEVLVKQGGGEALLDLLNSHMTAIISGPRKGVVKMVGEGEP